jgi:hypothetical protein
LIVSLAITIPLLGLPDAIQYNSQVVVPAIFSEPLPLQTVAVISSQSPSQLAVNFKELLSHSSATKPRAFPANKRLIPRAKTVAIVIFLFIVHLSFEYNNYGESKSKDFSMPLGLRCGV